MDFSRYEHAIRRAPWLGMLAVLAVAAPSAAHADDAPGFDRPGLGFSPQVLAAGDVSLEQGLPDWSRDHTEGSSNLLYVADTLLRLGLGGPLELQVGNASWNRLRTTSHDGRHVQSGRGDSNLALKLALPSSDETFSWGMLGGVEFTDGARAFRGPSRQWSLSVVGNLKLGEQTTLGAYLQESHVAGQNGQLLAVSDNFALTQAWTVYAEAALEHDAGSRGGALAGVGAAWMVTPRVQLDLSARHRLGGQVDDWQAGLGASIYLGK